MLDFAAKMARVEDSHGSVGRPGACGDPLAHAARPVLSTPLSASHFCVRIGDKRLL